MTRTSLSKLGLLAGLGAALLCSGCDAITQMANPEVPLWYHHPGRAVSVFFKRQLTDENRKKDEADERATPEIDPVHRRIFVGSSDRGLYALSAVSGETIWRFETAGVVHSRPLYDLATDQLFFGSNDGAVYCLRAADGELRWRFSTAAMVTRQPVLHRGTLFVVNGNDYLIAIDAESGKLRWYQHRTPAFGMEISGYAGPAVLDDKVFAAYSDGVVMAYSTNNGAELWNSVVDLTAEAEQVRTGEELRYLDVDTTPVVVKRPQGDLVVVASYEGGLYALDASSGAQEWVNDAATGVTELTLWESPARPQPLRMLAALEGPGQSDGQTEQLAKGEAHDVHRVLVASSGTTGLWGFDPLTGKKLWRRDLPAGGISKAEPWGGAILVGTTRYGVFLISPLNGGVIDALHSGGVFAAAPVAHGLRAYILSNEGVLLGMTMQRPPRAEVRFAELSAARMAARKAARERAEKEAEKAADKSKPDEPAGSSDKPSQPAD